jgi:hypothetical protein
MMAKLVVVKNGRGKDTCYNKIGLCAQIIICYTGLVFVR